MVTKKKIQDAINHYVDNEERYYEHTKHRMRHDERDKYIGHLQSIRRMAYWLTENVIDESEKDPSCIII